MGQMEEPPEAAEAIRWARSGAMSLTGSPDGAPRLTPWGLATGMDRLADQLAELTVESGRPVRVDGPALLGERAACAGFRRQGALTVGGAGRMVAAADGWVVVQLPRDSDWELLGALVGADRGPEDWMSLERAVGGLRVADIVEIGQLLGLAVAGVGRGPARDLPGPSEPTRWHRRRLGGEPMGTPRRIEGLRVLDLSALWAGPLCANLLGLAGAEVTKLEDPRRPDGARRGPKRFYELLHRGHRSVSVDLTSPAGRQELSRLIEASDVVIEASRPRALDQLGIDPDAIAGPLIWLSITGYGRYGPRSNAIGFGDDSAVAAGAWLDADGGPGARPHFVADALADPITGLTAAVAVLGSIARGGGELLDISLVGAVGDLLQPVEQSDVEVANAGGDEWMVRVAGSSESVAPPRARP